MHAATEIITRAASYPMDHVVARYADDEDISVDVATEHERELKRFLALCAANGGKRYGMRGPIDHLWHTFIMFTKDYADFCDSVAGRFIHHVPEPKGQAATPASRSSYEAFLADYEKMFGEPAPTHLWPRFAENSDEGANCGGCNGCHACSTGIDP